MTPSHVRYPDFVRMSKAGDESGGSALFKGESTMAVNPMAYSSKDVVLDVVRTERGKFYDVIDNPDNWRIDTRCEGWQVRDMVGHMIDVSEGYLARWDMARKGEYPQGLGWLVMAEQLNKGALALRSLS